MSIQAIERQDAALLNNLGVDSLRRLDFDQAPDLLRDALKEMLSQYQMRLRQSDEPLSSVQCDSTMPSLCDTDQSSNSESEIDGDNIKTHGLLLSTPTFVTLIAPLYETNQMNGHYIYEYLHPHALYLSPTTRVAIPTEVSIAVRSSVILYNLGLLFHLKSIQEGESNVGRDRLQKAMALYYKAKRLLTQSGISPTEVAYSLNDDERIMQLLTDFLHISLLNKLCCVNHQLQQYEAAQSNIRQLVQLIVSLPPSTEDFDDPSIYYMETTKSFFLLNIMSLKCPSMAAAA